MEKELPEGWVEVSVGEISQNVKYGYTAKSIKRDLGVRYLRITDIQDNRVDWETVPSCEVEENEEEKFRLNVDDIVFARTGATVGKSYLIESLPYRSVFASYLIRLRITELVNVRLVKYFFDSRDYWIQVSESAAGIGQPNVNASKLQKIKLNLPPFREQKRIVAKLDELFGHIDALKTKLDRIPALLKNFRQQVLTQAVTGKLTEEWRKDKDLGEWEERTIGSLGSWSGGGTPSKSNKSFWENGTVSWITPKDMKSLFLNDSMDKITIESIEKSSAKLVEAESILIVTRSGILRRVLPVGMNLVKTTVNQDIKVLTPKEDILPKFLLYGFIGLERSIRSGCMKAGTTVESIEFSLLKDYRLNLPSRLEQQEIVNRVEGLFAKADKIEAQYNSLKTKIDTLPQAILNKAFKGELVPQDPNDEPASVLLERIKGIKTDSKKGTKAYKEPQGEIPMAAEPK